MSDLFAQPLDGRVYAGQGIGTTPVGRWERYSPPSDSWDSLSGVGVIYQRASSVADGKIYVAGGVENGGPLNRAEVFDPTTNIWSSIATMPTTRALATAATADGQIYVLGGYASFGASTASTINERYDPGTDSWQTMAPMLRPRQGASAVALGGKIYLFGGIDGSGLPNTFWDIVDVYDPIADAWQELSTRMPTPRSDAGAAIHGNRIFLVGGTNLSSSFLTAFEAYDPVADTWSSLDTTNLLPRSTIGAAVLDDIFYVVGGNGIQDGQARTLDSVQAFDLVTSVSEPGTLSMIAIGFGALIVYRRRFRFR